MDWARELAERLQGAVNGEKNMIISEYGVLTGKSTATLYRIASNHGYNSGRKKRKDKGVLKSGLTDEQIQFVSTLIQESRREVKGTIMPLSTALDIAIDNGVIRKGQVSEARLQGILREREMNAAALNSEDPSIRMASLHPNHVHVFDASVCVQYYLKKGKGLRIMDERDFREKKPANFEKIKQRLIRVILADHFSHCLYLKYYLAASENQQTTFDFLTSAWRGGCHEKFPFRGVPKFLLMDAASWNIAKGILGLLNGLDVDIPKNMPHNPRRQGSAEVAQNMVETHFESRLRLEPATTVEQINEWATDWATWWNGTRIHRRHKMTRTECWLKITSEQLRELPSDDIIRDLFAEPEVERTVRNDNTITFRSEDYRLKHIPGIRPRKKVLVRLRPYHWPEVAVVYNDTEYLVQPIGKLDGGFSADAAIIGEEYKSQPDTNVQKTKKVNENLAYGEERKKDAVPFDGTLQVFGHHADKLGNVSPMPKRGIPIEVGRESVDARIPIMTLFKRLRDAGETMTPELNRELRANLGDSVDVKHADEIVAAITEGKPWHQTEARQQKA